MTEVNFKELEVLAVNQLKTAGIESAEFEAKQIVEAAKNTQNPQQEVQRMLKMRKMRHPLQYILGEWEFFGLEFKVGVGVLIPRADTEILVEKALGLLKGRQKQKVLDVCAGSGCIGIALAANSDINIAFLEKSRQAIDFLKENLKLNKIDGTVIECDVLTCPDFSTFGMVDLIVSNPPYIKTDVIDSLQEEVKQEPIMALDGGNDGLKFYRAITEKSKSALNKNGHLCFEIGFDQADDVCDILKQNGFCDISLFKDYGANNRVVIGKKI